MRLAVLTLASLLLLQPALVSQKAVSMHHVIGTFEVKMKPETLSEAAAPSGLGRVSIDKIFHGALEATSKGEMLSVMDMEKGSGGYVAIERVTGTLDGHAGSFVLQHSGSMNRGTPQLSVTVVADSATGELTGLNGSMKIDVAAGKHSYTSTTAFSHSAT